MPEENSNTSDLEKNKDTIVFIINNIYPPLHTFKCYINNCIMCKLEK